MKESCCFFIGHHDAPESIYPALVATVERHVTQSGVTEFVMGRYGSFDRMAARAVRTVKERRQGITLTLLLPYHPADCPAELREAFGDYDGTYYPMELQGVPKRFAIVRANRLMAEQCDYLIAYLHRPAGNTATVAARARCAGAEVTLL